MENDRKDRLLLLLIFRSIVVSAMYVNNPVIDGISFQNVILRFIPFLANYNPVTIGLTFIIICFAIAFLFSDKSIPSKHQDHSGDSRKPKPIVQNVFIRPIVERPLISSKHQPESLFNTSRSKKKQNTYHSFQPKKKRLVIRNYYDKRNRRRFGW